MMNDADSRNILMTPPVRSTNSSMACQSAVFGYARLRIVDGMFDRIFAARAIFNPARDEMSCQPQAPSELQTHAALNRCNGDNASANGQQGQLLDAPDDHVHVARLERVEELLAPPVDRQSHQHVGDQTAEKTEREQPGREARVALPESKGQANKPSDQATSLNPGLRFTDWRALGCFCGLATERHPRGLRTRKQRLLWRCCPGCIACDSPRGPSSFQRFAGTTLTRSSHGVLPSICA
jgi:hypothetical protein